MKILNVEAHNVLRVEDIRFDLEGHHLFLVGGKNAQGKSSAINSLRMALCGKRGMDYPDVPLREGERKGWVRVSLSGDPSLHEDVGLTVEMLLRRRRNGTVAEEIRVIESTGELAPEPRETLSRVLKIRGYDPLEFEKMKPAQQRDKLQEMLGVDLSAFDTRRKKAYDERTNVGRDAKRLAARADGMPKHTGVPAEEVSVSQLVTELEAAKKQNESRASLAQSIAWCLETKEKIHKENRSRESKIEQLRKQIADLEQEIAEEKEAIKETEAREKELAEQYESDPSVAAVDETVIREKINGAEATNAKVRDNAARAVAMKEANASQAKYDALTETIKKIDDDKAEAIANAEWPVKGMEFTEDGLMLNGLPFEQASKSERIIASTKIGMAMNPTLRLLICQDGSDLDTETLDALQKVLEEHDFQMIVELVTRSQEDMDRCAVVISNGTVVGAVASDDDNDTDETEGTDDGDAVPDCDDPRSPF